MKLTEYQAIPDTDKKVVVSLDLLSNVENKFIVSITEQWQQGKVLTIKQRMHLYSLTENHLRSIERGYGGLKGANTTNTTKEIVRKQKKLRYKYKYRTSDIEALLDYYAVKAVRSVSPEGKIGWDVGGDWYPELLEFVIWATDGDPSHPLAGGILE